MYMKKILGILILGGMLLNNFYFANAFNPNEVQYPDEVQWENYFGDSLKPVNSQTNTKKTETATKREITDEDVKNEKQCKDNWWIWDYEAWKCDYWTAGWPTVQWIRMNDKCLLNWQCWFNIYQFLGLRQSISDNNSPELFVQDILLSATFFIGTIVTIAFIVSWLMFIFAGASGKSPDKAKAGIKNSLIGLLIVVSSYSIIRIVQYIAKGL